MPDYACVDILVGSNVFEVHGAVNSRCEKVRNNIVNPWLLWHLTLAFLTLPFTGLSPELKLLEEVLLAETLQDTSIVDLPFSPILPQIALLWWGLSPAGGWWWKGVTLWTGPATAQVIFKIKTDCGTNQEYLCLRTGWFFYSGRLHHKTFHHLWAK